MGLATFCDETELGLILLIIKANCFKVQMQVIGPVLCVHMYLFLYINILEEYLCVYVYIAYIKNISVA